MHNGRSKNRSQALEYTMKRKGTGVTDGVRRTPALPYLVLFQAHLQNRVKKLILTHYKITNGIGTPDDPHL